MVCESVDGAANASRSTGEDMGVYHRGLYIPMAQEFLDRSDIVTAFEQVSCERMPESMARGPLGQSGLCDSIFHSFLNQRFAGGADIVRDVCDSC